MSEPDNYVDRLLVGHFGGSTARCAEQTGVPRRTLDYWRFKRHIPERRKDDFVARCGRAGVHIGSADLEPQGDQV